MPFLLKRENNGDLVRCMFDVRLLAVRKMSSQSGCHSSAVAVSVVSSSVVAVAVVVHFHTMGSYQI